MISILITFLNFVKYWQFKRANLLQTRYASGVVLHYTLSEERNNLHVCLLNGASDAVENGVELVDEIGDEDLNILPSV